jgi:hypothetical protein
LDWHRAPSVTNPAGAERNWIIGLLDYWIIGLLDYWIIGLMDLWMRGWVIFSNNPAIQLSTNPMPRLAAFLALRPFCPQFMRPCRNCSKKLRPPPMRV